MIITTIFSLCPLGVQPVRQRRKLAPQPEEPQQNPDDIVDISYVGGHIPSRSFRVLQHAVGEQSDDTEGW